MKPVPTHDRSRDPTRHRTESPGPARDDKEGGSGKQTPKRKKGKSKINKDMIKRVEGGGVGMVNPMGWYDYSPSHTPGRMSFVGMRPGGANVPEPTSRDEPVTATGTGTATGTASRDEAGQQDERGRAPHAGRLADGIARAKAQDDSAIETDSDSDDEPSTNIAQPFPITASQVPPTILQAQDYAPNAPARIITSSPPAMSDVDESAFPGHTAVPTKTPYAGRVADEDAFPRAKTIAFEDDRDGVDHDHHPATAFPALGPPTSQGNGYGPSRGFTSAREGGFFPRTGTTRSGAFPRTATTGNFPRTYTMASRKPQTKYNHFGGFPSPLKLLGQLAKKAFPEKHRTLTQTLTMPRTNTIGRKGTIVSESNEGVEKEVPYISFAAVVGRNSKFEGLTEEQMDELGGVEYRALRILMWIAIGVRLPSPLAWSVETLG